MHIIKVLSIVSVLLFFCCNSENDKTKKVGELTFKVGFHVRPKFTGVLPSKNNSEELIYFADPVTHKVIKFFNLKGELKDSIPLNEALKYVRDVDGIAIISKDTIIINSQYTNKIITLNSKGVCWHISSIDRQLVDSNQNVYELHTSMIPNSITDPNKILYNCDFRYNLNDIANNLEPTKQLDYLQYYNEKARHAPYFFQITDNYTSNPKKTFFLHDFYSKISEKHDVIGELPHYKSEKDFTYLVSVYSDKLFIINNKDNKISKEITVSSNHTNIGIKPMTLNTHNMYMLQDIINTKLRTKGYISRVAYNPISKKHYVLVYHSMDKDLKNERGKLSARPFSVIVYDSLFTKQNEYIFTNYTYRSAYSLMTSLGLIIRKKTTNDAIFTYTVFDF